MFSVTLKRDQIQMAKDKSKNSHEYLFEYFTGPRFGSPRFNKA